MARPGEGPTHWKRARVLLLLGEGSARTCQVSLLRRVVERLLVHRLAVILTVTYSEVLRSPTTLVELLNPPLIPGSFWFM